MKGRDYPAYTFANHSEDILDLFSWACDLTGIHWRRASRVRISIARRADVARLDALMDVAAEPAVLATPCADAPEAELEPHA